jgi:hypothetical protein
MYFKILTIDSEENVEPVPLAPVFIDIVPRLPNRYALAREI